MLYVPSDPSEGQPSLDVSFRLAALPCGMGRLWRFYFCPLLPDVSLMLEGR